jgi:TatD DNase family protein
MLVDTHCHIHEPSYPLNQAEALARARQAGVTQMICVGTSEKSSRETVEFAAAHDGVFASIGVHPHDTKDGWREILTLAGAEKLVAVGEIGLDYYYDHSSRDIQITALEEQLAFALKQNLPVIFHVRDAFDDFWPIFDNFHGVRGVLHSFTDTAANVEEGLKRGLYFGVNGISTFTKDSAQREMFARIPLERLLLETDAPFLTPTPLRGKINEPAFVRYVADTHATLRRLSTEEIAAKTTANARALFALV